MASALLLLAHDALGGPAAQAPAGVSTETKEKKWDFSLSTSTYVARQAQDYVNPVFTADRRSLHLEARYNYEALETGSLWLGHNFRFGKALAFEATPMLGGVFGNLTGVAPGYELSLTYKQFALSTQGEFVFDTGNRAGNFFYTWSELSYAPVKWLSAGMVLQRTKANGRNSDIQPGVLVGFNYKKVNVTTYFINPGSKDANIIFALTVDF